MQTNQGRSEVSKDDTTVPDPWAPEHLPPLELAQVVEDCLFAYVNAQSLRSREMMWPMLVESVEALIADSRRRLASEGDKQ
ncbi:MAG TPA: hypothetical protein HPQ00_12000 [Magnetococcales bacterium]|nr:hypothetical protein [Magnetococcales bacterium]